MAIAEVTVTLSSELVEKIDRVERDRSRFVASAVERELARLQCPEPMCSGVSPHFDAEVTDGGFGDWATSLPSLDAVDPSAGHLRRWIEAQGWVDEE
jgi:hypothetical protein